MKIIDKVASKIISKVVSDKIGAPVTISLQDIEIERHPNNLGNPFKTSVTADVLVLVDDASLETITQNLQLL